MPKIFVNDININYMIQGNLGDPTVMFSNSLATTLSMWDLQAHVLAQSGFCVVRYDSRGHGESDAPEGAYSIETLADDAAALIERLNISPVHFCGLSKGGMVAQMMGVRHADKIQTLIIADSAAFMPVKDIWEQRILAVRNGGMEAVVDGTLDRWVTAAGRKRLPDQVKLIKEMILNTPPHGFIGCSEAIKNMDMRPSNPLIKKATLVLCGEEDTGTTPEQAREIAESISDARLILIPEAAHLANIEQSDKFTSCLVSHIRKSK
jgi:3-oxoadipate enol-lactonase